MNIVIGLLNILIIGWVAWHIYNGSGDLKPVFWPAFTVKMAGGIGLGLVYFYYYGAGDTISYFSDAAQLAALCNQHPDLYIKFLWNHHTDSELLGRLIFQDSRALLFSKIVSIFYLITSGNYWISTLHFSLFSFLGSWYLVRKISVFFPGKVIGAMIALLFFPSVVFWSSGIIKESLAMASIFFLSGIFLVLWFDQKVKWLDWILVIVSAWVLWNLKYYFAAIFFAVVINTLLYKFVVIRLLKPKSFVLHVTFWCLLFFVPVIIVVNSHPNFAIENLLYVVTENYNAFISISSPEDVIHFNNLEPVPGSIIVNIPLALLSGLFRPFLWESTTFFQFLAAVENLFLLAGFVIALFFKNKIDSQYRLLVFTTVVYIVLLCIFITLSTPNFGTLSRYRVAYIPFFAFLLLCSALYSPILERVRNRLVPKHY